jgi:hypothetical protein
MRVLGERPEHLEGRAAHPPRAGVQPRVVVVPKSAAAAPTIRLTHPAALDSVQQDAASRSVCVSGWAMARLLVSCCDPMMARPVSSFLSDC